MNKILENAQVGFSFVLREGEKDTVYYINSEQEMCERRLPYSRVEGNDWQEFSADILDIVSANYRWSGDIVEVFDPECEEYEKLELPVYYENGICVGTKVENVPTLKMIEKAKEYKHKKISGYLLLADVQDGLRYNKNHICTVVDTFDEIALDTLNKDEFCVICIARPSGRNNLYHYLVIDKKIAKFKERGGTLHMRVPASVVDYVLGKTSLCTRGFIANKLGVKQVIVKAD